MEIAISIYKFLVLKKHFTTHINKWINKNWYKIIPHVWTLDLSALDRRIAKMATSPLANAATAATARDGELPPPKS